GLGGAPLGLDLRDERRLPRLRGFLEIDVAVDALVDPLSAEGLEPRIESPADRAEVLVARIAEGEHGVAKLLELRGTVTHPVLEEGLRALRGIAEPVGRDDERRLLDPPQALRIVIAQVDELRARARSAQPLLDGLRDAPAVARFGRVENHPRRRRLLLLLRGGPRRRRRRPAGGKPGEVAARPDQLLAIEMADDLVEPPDRFLREGGRNGVRANCRHVTVVLAVSGRAILFSAPRCVKG